MFLRILSLIAATFFVVSSAPGQTTGTATLTGAVTDSTGSVVPGAKVTVTNTATGVVITTSTTTEGTYYVPALNPGSYRVGIEAAGFKQYVRDGIILRTAEQPRIDVQLEVGAVSESVQVTGAPPLLETETSASGMVLEGDTIVKLPVLQKAFNRIVLYTPGMNVVNGQHAVGQRQRSFGMTIDGVSGKEPVLGNPNDVFRIQSATLDMIQEFKVWTTGMPAEFGHSSGGLLSGVFRSGTNQFHGSLEDRYLNGRLVHRQYFEQLKRCQNLVTCNPFTYHELSATAGGPIYIPKIYNGKDRTFFFFGFQRHHEKVTETFIGAVPTPQMYGGDFNFGANSFPVFDPDTTRQEGTRWVRDPFPGNVVPQNRFDPVSRNILSRNPWRQANTAGVPTPTGPAQNLVVPTLGRYYFNRWDWKVDHNFSTNHRMFGRYSLYQNNSLGRISNEPEWRLIDRIVVEPIRHHSVVLSDTYTLSPTLINDFRFGLNRRNQTRLPNGFNENWAQQLGIPNVGPETFPDIVRAGGGRFYSLGPGGKYQQVAEDYMVQNNITKILGKHTIKGGYELMRTRYNSLVESLPSGRYFMGASDQPFTPNTGNDFASFLLGTAQRAEFTNAVATWLPRWWSHAWFIQNDYKPRRNLTLNLGLRWSYESPFGTKYGQNSQFDPAATDPITGRLGAIVHRPGPLAKKDLNNFQPRIGMAWNFSPKWVFRGNFGLVTSDLFVNALNVGFEEYFATANIQSNPGDPRHAFKLSQGPPSFRFNVNPDGSVPFVGTNFGGRSATFWDPNMRNPYVMNWSGGFQWEFRPQWLTEIQYQGSAGVGLLNNWDMNVVPLDVSRDFATLDRIRTSYQNFRPYNQFGAIQHYSNYGHNTYHGVTFRVEKRYSSGMTLNSFFTFSKSINDVDEDGGAGGITFYNRRLEKGRAAYDVRNRWVTTWTYELPFGKGKKWMNNGGIRNHLFGGWELVWIQTFQTGTPFTVSFAGSPNVYLPGASRPNQVLPNDQAKLKHVDIGPNRFPFAAQNRYLNFDAFAYPDSFTPGTLGRNTLEAPGIVWAQASLSKEWTIFERLRFHLRFDANNITKYHSFNPPNASFNLRDRSAFGTFNGTRGSFSDVGTGRWHGIMVFRLQW
ncbi:MAG: carboxypeptidase-like regulatory domain-containing protein [Bryobacteraceae bacterium]|nr:carboxypeptidase-like regulatory domain-containing protein [Bryobacteraceae bacterium]